MLYIPQVWQFDTDYPAGVPSDEELGVQAINVKTHDGTSYMATFDTHPQAVTGPGQWAKLVKDYQQRGILATPWCVPAGRNPTVEVEMASAILDVSGELVLDVEGPEGPYFWQGGRDGVKRYIEPLRQRHPGAKLILQYDVRWPTKIYLEEWLPYVDELLSMSYWTTFQRSMGEVLFEARRLMVATGKPYRYTYPGDALEYPDTAHTDPVYIWRRGTMGAAAQALLKAQPRPEPAKTLEQRVDDLYQEATSQAVQLQALRDEMAALKAHLRGIPPGGQTWSADD